MKHLFTFVTLLCCYATVQAQLPAKIAQQATQAAALRSPSLITEKLLLNMRLAGADGLANAVELEIMRRQIQQQQAARAVTPTDKSASLPGTAPQTKEPLPSIVAEGTLTHYAGTHGALMGADYRLVQSAEQKPLQAALAIGNEEVSPARAKRGWLEQQKRNYRAYQLRKQRREQHFQEIKAQLDEQELELAKAALPPLEEAKAFKANDFADFVPVARQQPKPTVPYVAQPGTIAYRGLALAVDGDAVRNILENGLRLQDAGEENSTLRLAYASHGGYSAMRFLLENPVTNLTYGPNSAASWGARRLGPGLPILTLVKVRGTFVGDSLETATEDIPASQIEELAVRLNLEGNLTWCKVTLNEDRSFTLTPYEPFYPVR